MNMSSTVPHDSETNRRGHHDEETNLIDHDILVVILPAEDAGPVEIVTVGGYSLVLEQFDNLAINVDDNRLGTGYTSAATGNVLNRYTPSIGLRERVFTLSLELVETTVIGQVMGISIRQTLSRTVVLFTTPSVRGAGTSITFVHDVLSLGVLVVVVNTNSFCSRASFGGTVKDTIATGTVVAFLGNDFTCRVLNTLQCTRTLLNRDTLSVHLVEHLSLGTAASLDTVSGTVQG